jgi:predicted ATPase
MEGELTLKNYRCFPDDLPCRFTVRPGFIAFVGPNNAGKSSLLRFFYEFRNLFQSLVSADAIQTLIRGRKYNFGPPKSVKDLNELFCDSNERDLTIEIKLHSPAQAAFPLPKSVVITVPRGTNQYSATFIAPTGQMQNVDDNMVQEKTIVFRADNNMRLDMTGFYELMAMLASTLYVGPFRNIINVGTNEEYFDIQIGQAFVRAWRNYKSGDTRRDSLAALRVSTDLEKLFGFRRLEINASQSDDTLQVIIDDKPYKLNEIGTGFAQFMITLTNAAIKKPRVILIDEPEMSLHPSLQLDFLTTLGSYASDGVIFSTHNIGLARAAADAVYGVRRLAQSKSEIYSLEDMPRLSEFVGELSFFGYRELGFDKILLVEGPTDVRTMQQFLRMVGKDHKVVILHLGGSAMINGKRDVELQEIRRISDHVFALIDSERTSAGAAISSDRGEFQARCQAAQISCTILQRRAIENYLSEQAVKTIKGDNYRALGPYEDLKAVSPAWAKEENWKIARAMSISDLDSTDLKDFLQGL